MKMETEPQSISNDDGRGSLKDFQANQYALMVIRCNGAWDVQLLEQTFVRC